MEVGVEGCSSVDVQAQLASLLASDAFRRSPSLGRFLSYLVTRALAGERESVKEHHLAVKVFDRGEDFDPRDDTIVRVQARNLRTRLDEYYQLPSAANKIRFVMQKGYALQFEPISPAPAQPEAIDAPAKAIAPFFAPRSPALLAAIVILAAITGWVFFSSKRGSGVTPSRVANNTTLLVAPFANLSSDKDNEYFASGLTEELTDALSNLPGLRVVARSASSRWKEKDLDFANLRQLGIGNVVEGSVRKEGNKVRISVRLVEVLSGTHLWSHEYDRDIQASIATEQEIAGAIAATLKLTLASGAERTAVRPPNPDAYDLYLKGRYYWHKIEAPSATKGIQYLERSIEIDPAFAPAYVALAGCYGSLGIFYAIPPADSYAKIRELTLKALQLDDSLAEAHTLLGGVYAWNDWNWSRAELEYRGAVQLAPQSVIAHQYYASFLGALGRQDEAETQMREALRLDPLDTLLQWAEAQLMHWRGENQQAEALLKKIEKQEPDFGLTAQLLAEVDWALGKDQEAEAALRGRLAKHPADPLPLGELGYGLAKSGRTAEARKIVATLRELPIEAGAPPHAIALVYIGLGEDAHAIKQLWLACDRKTLRAPWLRVEPVYASLKRNPRFAELLAHTNLEAK